VGLRADQDAFKKRNFCLCQELNYSSLVVQSVTKLLNRVILVACVQSEQYTISDYFNLKNILQRN
jgi:hypothetical protein